MANTSIGGVSKAHANYGGGYSITGTLRKLGAPTPGHLFLHKLNDMRLIDSQDTTDGTYSFAGITDQEGYVVIGQDEDGTPVGITADLTLVKVEHPG